jgi:hypothetical protein
MSALNTINTVAPALFQCRAFFFFEKCDGIFDGDRPQLRRPKPLNSTRAGPALQAPLLETAPIHD